MHKLLHNTHWHNRARGFTLIEALVSLTLFMYVVTVSAGTLVVMVDANARAQNIQSVISNLSFALDSMTRDIRTGRDYFCPDGVITNNLPTSGDAVSDCGPTSKSNRFSFNESGGSLTSECSPGDHRIGYRLNNARIERKICDSGWASVTAPEVEVTTMQFVVSGSNPDDNHDPLVTIFIEGIVAEVPGEQGKFSLQTTLTQQQIDI